jgi:hypothetical protein
MPARALSALATAVLVFQTTYASPPPTLATDPSPAPAVVTADPTITPTPAATSAPAATAAPAVTQAATPSPAPSASPDASPAPGLDPLPVGATEVVAKRTETSRTYRKADGTMATDLYTQPVFYHPTGSKDWAPVEPGFASSAEAGVDAGATGPRSRSACATLATPRAS